MLVGAHYDSETGTPGANDNASGVAATLELARRLSGLRFAKSIRFVLFANEESPYFQSPGMGSLVHARGCRERGERIDAMLSLESLGYYSDTPGSQRYPWPVGLLYPDRGNFIGFVGNLGSRSLVRRAIGLFRESTPVPSEGAAFPRRYRASAGPITGHSGNSTTRRSWSRILPFSGIRTITNRRTCPETSTSSHLPA